MKNVAVLKDGIVVDIHLWGDDYTLLENEKEYDESNPAFIGGDYVDGYFYGIQPFPSWKRDNGVWVPPVPRPDTQDNWYWDEELGEFSIYNG